MQENQLNFAISESYTLKINDYTFTTQTGIVGDVITFSTPNERFIYKNTGSFVRKGKSALSDVGTFTINVVRNSADYKFLMSLKNNANFTTVYTETLIDANQVRNTFITTALGCHIQTLPDFRVNVENDGESFVMPFVCYSSKIVYDTL